jgi:hypothetical protein
MPKRLVLTVDTVDSLRLAASDNQNDFVKVALDEPLHAKVPMGQSPPKWRTP